MAVGDKLVTLDGLKAVYQDVNGNVNDLKIAVGNTDETFSNFLESEVGITVYPFHAYGNLAWNTASSPVELKVPNNTGWKYCMIPCEPGDVFHVKINAGTSNYRPWAFVTSDFEKITGGTATANVVDADLTAPETAAYLLCNVRCYGDYVYEVTKGTNLIDGKQDTLTFDAVPTENSTNPVTSGGVYASIAEVDGAVTALNAMTGPAKNLYNDAQMGAKTDVTTVSAHEFSGQAKNINGTLAITGDYKTGARYTVSASAYDATASQTGNGLRLVAYYTDETSEYVTWQRDTNSYEVKSLTSASGKNVDHFTISYGSGASDSWYIKNIQIEESNGATTFAPYAITDIDTVARKKYDAETTGDTADRTNDIQAALQTNGVCRLGPGLFCTTGITMPAGTMIIGCGSATEIRLLPTEDENNHIAVNLSAFCTVKNVSITGSAEELAELPETFGNRQGIGYYGTGSGSTIKCCVIEGCYIRSFTGGGITAYNTGYGTKGLSVSDCNIYNCYCGFHDEHLSEYHCLHGCNITNNHVGVLNNGGNNRFVSCNITGNEIGFMMDNSSGTHNNDGHGVCVGCVLHHNNIPIYIHSGDSGFTFTGCSIAPDETSNDGTFIINSVRTVFSGCNFCKDQKITVDGGGLLMFIGCIFRSDLSTKFTNVDDTNTSIVFDSCYTDSGVNVNPVSA